MVCPSIHLFSHKASRDRANVHRQTERHLQLVTRGSSSTAHIVSTLSLSSPLLSEAIHEKPAELHNSPSLARHGARLFGDFEDDSVRLLCL